MAVVLAVRNVDSLRFCQSSREARRDHAHGTRVPTNTAPRHPETSRVIRSPRRQPRVIPMSVPTRLHVQTRRGYFAITAR
jgi:hypothetical protein